MKLSDEVLKCMIEYGVIDPVGQWDDYHAAMARELLELRGEKERFQTIWEPLYGAVKAENVKLSIRLAAAERVVEESRLLQSDGFLRYEEALESYDKVVKGE